jgi:hypothetical protein
MEQPIYEQSIHYQFNKIKNQDVWSFRAASLSCGCGKYAYSHVSGQLKTEINKKAT